MLHRILLACTLATVVLSGCGGDAGRGSAPPVRLLAVSSAAPTSFPGVRADYAIVETAGGYTVSELAGHGAVTAVPRNARLRFADISLALDLDGVAGAGFRLYRAAFARAPDAAGLGYWIARMDAGAPLPAVAGEFVASAEFQALYGAHPGNAELVDKLYRNVLHRAGEAAGVAYWIGVLERGAATRAQVLAWFSESAENRAGVRQAILGGIYYLEDGVAYVPQADPGPDRMVELGQPVTLDGGASTVAVGKPIAWAWRFGARPAASAAVLAGAGSAHPSFVPDLPGKYELKLVVSDGTSSSREMQASVATIWRPAAGQVPASGNYVYLQSEPGDAVGGGATYTYTQADAVLEVAAAGPQLTVQVHGEREWRGDIAVTPARGRFEPGYYGRLGNGSELEQASISWRADGSGCAADGWIAVDNAAYEGDTLVALELRFEQQCGGTGAPLRGQVHWAPGDATRPPGPVPVPAPPAMGSWQPPPGATPASGNYLYLLSEAGDYLGDGKTYLLAGADVTLDVRASQAHVQMRVTGPDGTWYGDFGGMAGLERVTPGYYAGLRRYGFHNPAKGGLDWRGLGRGCDSVNGWFAVDQVTYVNGAIAALDLRFVQHCNGSVPVIHGKIHWAAG